MVGLKGLKSLFGDGEDLRGKGREIPWQNLILIAQFFPTQQILNPQCVFEEASGVFQQSISHKTHQQLGKMFQPSL